MIDPTTISMLLSVWAIGMLSSMLLLLMYDNTCSRFGWSRFPVDLVLPVCMSWPISILYLIGLPGFLYIHKRFGHR